jgi:hypothetical protein
MRATQRRARELLGWTILTTVGTLARFAIWVDAATARSADAAR